MVCNKFFLVKTHSVEFYGIQWNLMNHWSMNWDQFKCSLCCPCLCGTVLAPMTLKQEAVGSNTTFYNFCYKFCRMCQLKCNSFSFQLFLPNWWMGSLVPGIVVFLWTDCLGSWTGLWNWYKNQYWSSVKDFLLSLRWKIIVIVMLLITRTNISPIQWPIFFVPS